MKESQLYMKIRKALPNFELQRVENELDLGTPDVYFSLNKEVNGWIELKQFKLPKRLTTQIKIPFRPGQYAWARRFIAKGTTVLLVCMTGDGLFVFKGDNIKQVYDNYNDFYKCFTYHTRIISNIKIWLEAI